jgi:cyclic-di-AMP phosphodiesterase PgpH
LDQILKKTSSNNNDMNKSAWKRKLSSNDLLWRLLVGFLCWISIALFIHFREVKVDILELNATAGKYIVAQVDFEFPDEESTIILRQQAILDIGNIYKINEKQLRQVCFDFESYLIDNDDWKKYIPQSSYDKVYQVSSALEDLLLEIRFADARTVQKMKELDLSVDDYMVFSQAQSPETTKLTLGSQYWEQAREDSLIDRLKQKISGMDPKTLDFVTSFFIKKQWNLVPDIQAQTNLRHTIEKNIPPILSRIKAGTKIIDQNEKVTSRHIAMIQSMKKQLSKFRNEWSWNTVLGNLLLALIFVFISALYFKIDQPEILKSLQKLSLIACAIILSLAFAKISEYIILRNTTNISEAIRYPILVPFAVILMSILINSRVAIFVSFFLSVLMAIVLAVDHSRFLVVNLVASLVVIISTRNLRKRKEVFWVCGKCLLAVIPIIFAFDLINKHFYNFSFFVDISHSIIFMLIIAILVVGILPLLESLFNVMTDITLMEYMDPSNELLKRLSLEVPGTYQHSLVLGNIAETAAQAIGANGLFCRVATLYHDIGKLNNPHYFTENQQSGVNIHQMLTPIESAQVIISHVKDGEILARKYRLPQAFIDIIKEHHGTSLVYYFYAKELELKGGDKSKLEEKLFRYPGPKPHSKESAIIMICDVTEAASRSMDELSKESLTQMVNKLVGDKTEDGQLDECSLSFEELSIVKKTIVNILMLSQHARIKYPEKENKD